MRILTFARQFPAYHPKRGEPTHFVEKIWESGIKMLNAGLLPEEDIYFSTRAIDPKLHTIRAGNSWNVGDMFSPRVWSGKPYNSKQIEFAPPMEVKRVWEFEIIEGRWRVSNDEIDAVDLNTIAENDGLTLRDFYSWFRWPKEFSGQIISWSETLNY